MSECKAVLDHHEARLYEVAKPFINETDAGLKPSFATTTYTHTNPRVPTFSSLIMTSPPLIYRGEVRMIGKLKVGGKTLVSISAEEGGPLSTIWDTVEKALELKTPLYRPEPKHGQLQIGVIIYCLPPKNGSKVVVELRLLEIVTIRDSSKAIFAVTHLTR